MIYLHTEFKKRGSISHLLSSNGKLIRHITILIVQKGWSSRSVHVDIMYLSCHDNLLLRLYIVFEAHFMELGKCLKNEMKNTSVYSSS
jgi:hypothetical protein